MMKDEILARPATILLQLRAAELERPGGCSMARLRKLCDCRMSDLMRDLTLLVNCGLVGVEHDAAGNGSIALTPAGRVLGDTLAGAGP